MATGPGDGGPSQSPVSGRSITDARPDDNETKTPTTIDTHAAALQKLFPSGEVWALRQDGTFEKLLRGLATEPARVSERMLDLFREFGALECVEMLDRWEDFLGLPGGCAVGADLSVEDRRNAVIAKLRATGGASINYLLGIAQAIGGPSVRIEEFRVAKCAPETGDPWHDGGGSHCDDPMYDAQWEFFWKVVAPQGNQTSFASIGSNCGDPMAVYGIDTLECVLDPLVPAHTQVIYEYE